MVASPSYSQEAGSEDALALLFASALSPLETFSCCSKVGLRHPQSPLAFRSRGWRRWGPRAARSLRARTG
jgi:hypothetical protein